MIVVANLFLGNFAHSNMRRYATHCGRVVVKNIYSVDTTRSELRANDYIRNQQI